MAQGCNPGSNLPTLGGAGTTTLPPGTYTGTYHIVGNLLLTNGDYIFKGAIFYVDGSASRTQLPNGSVQRQVMGNTITLGANASLLLDGATLTAAGSTTNCPMWRGLVVDNQGQSPKSPYRLKVQNHSTISYALYGIDFKDSYNAIYAKNTFGYVIDKSTFAYNWTDISDTSYYPPQNGPSLITNCTFDSTNPTQMHYPYEQLIATDPSYSYYTYQALYLTPRSDNAFDHTVEVRDNTINQAVYGIVNNQYDTGGVLIQNNTLDKIFQTGIWTVNNDSYSGTTQPTASGNVVGLNDTSPNTDQISSTATRYGIVGEGPGATHYNAFVGNTVTGTGNFTSGYRQVGLSIYGQTDASGNLVQNVDEGISANELDGSDLFDNRLTGCTNAFIAKSYANGMNQVDRLGCNTFSRGPATGYTAGLVVENNATINDIGSFSNPAANKFDGLTDGIINDNFSGSFTYYQTNSPQESPTVGRGRVTLNTVRIRNLNNYCFSQGASHYNGVNRVTGPSASYLAAIMDSVRRQLVPPASYRNYLYEVVSYHATNQQLPALETWWATLAVPNAAAYRTVGRYLLSAYDAQRATVAAQRILLGLQPQALLNAELAAQLQLRAVVRHIPQTMPRLVAADSVLLRSLAWSGTSVAEPATRWLRYFYPRIPVPTPTPATPRLAVARKTVLAESGAVLGAAYPNPAQTEVTISCQLAQADQTAELRFTNLLTGQMVLVVPVVGMGTERSQRVPLANLPAGQYAYQLVVEGQLAAAPQKLLVNP